MHPQWTTFHHLQNQQQWWDRFEALTEEQKYEVWQILEQTSPLEDEPRNWMQHAYLNEEVFRQDREQDQMMVDMERLERLSELGMVDLEDETIFHFSPEDENV